MSDYLDLVVFGLIAALSPLAFAATLVVIRAGRLKAIAFGIGFVAAQFATCMALVRLGAWSLPHRDRLYPTVRALLAIGLGVWLLLLARKVRRTSDEPALAEPDGRSQAALERLGRVRSSTTFLVGVFLGVGVPRRLLITALAAASIAASASGDARKVALGAAYSIVATVIVWLPVLAFVLIGNRAIAVIDDTAHWFERRRRVTAFYALLLVGTGSVAIGLARVR